MTPHAFTDAESGRDVQPVHPLDGGLLTIEDAARLVALGRSLLYQEMDAGRLPYCKFGRARRIPRQALLDWAQAHLCGGWAVAPNPESDCHSQASGSNGLARAYSQGTARLNGNGGPKS